MTNYTDTGEVKMESKQYNTKELLERFIPYFGKYKGTLILDLFCAALTTLRIGASHDYAVYYK